MVVVHHYFILQFFGSRWFPFPEVLTIFLICLWLVPFSFFVSLSANENTLPSTRTSAPTPVSDSYGAPSPQKSSGGSRRQGLLSVFNYLLRKKDELLPSRQKRVF
eukprot:Colp12_sorted_trinity150504_noHs@22682